jgi:hypothetical protein
VRSALTLVVAVALLDASLSFRNIWPTPAIAWTGQLSIELAVGLLVVAALRALAARSRAPADRRASTAINSSRPVGVFALVWVLLVVGHYVDVTTPARYGRDINLYWDVRYMPDVAAMIARAAPWWLLALSVAIAALAFVALYLLFRWALTRLAAALDDRHARAALTLVASAVVVWFAVEWRRGELAESRRFSAPVTATYVRQARLIAGAMRASAALAPSPALAAPLTLVQGADVFLVFIESYGAIAFEKADVAPRLAAPRGELDAAIRATGRGVVSTFVDSPTFGGSSWLAHVTLLSGIEVRDPETNARLLTEHRDSLVTNFKRRGFRTVALMPGLRQRWPEGAFYGFDDIYGAARLAYRGPEFGWFAVPDQFSLARFDRLEVDRTPRPYLFVFYPTISTHFPFQPTPPYQPDWSRIFDEHPYDREAIVNAYARQPDWTHFSQGYVDAVAYTYRTLAGYFRKHADRDCVFVLLGDHQPAAAVTGEGASWSVPVHVVASRRAILDRLLARGFHEGLAPARPALGRMHALLPILLDAFSGRQPSAPSSALARTRGVALSN